MPKPTDRPPSAKVAKPAAKAKAPASAKAPAKAAAPAKAVAKPVDAAAEAKKELALKNLREAAKRIEEEKRKLKPGGYDSSFNRTQQGFKSANLNRRHQGK